MDAAWASLIAVGGTLLGAMMTHVFQRLNTERAERLARERHLRDERLAAYGAFAGAVVDYRRGQYDRAHRRLDGSASSEYREARAESFRLRSAAQQALFRVRLVTSDTEIIRCATDALKHTEVIHDAESKEEIRELGDRAKRATDEFISRASARLQASA